MTKKKLLISLFLSGIFLVMMSTSFVSAATDLYSAPSTKAGDTKILKVTTVDETGLEGMFGAYWNLTLQTAFGPGAQEKGARAKSVVKALYPDEELNLGFLGVYDTAIITVDYWNFTTADFSDTPDFTDLNVTILLNSTQFNDMCHLFYMGANVTVPLMGAFFQQLPVPPDDFLADLEWDTTNGWSADGKQIIHQADAGYYLKACTETWTYYDNGALIGYSLKDGDTTIYEYKLDIASVPGYVLPVFMGMTLITLIGAVMVLRKKRI
jgi:hypothetical protein